MHSTAPFTLRAATAADLDAIAAIENACFPAAEAASRDSFAQRLAVFPAHFWLVEQGGALVGFLNGAVLEGEVIDDACYHDANCHNAGGAFQAVFGINTLPEHRKQGIGGMMLRAMIADAKAQSRKGCILTCKDSLRAYYESFGFVCMGRSASTHGGAVWNDMILRF